MIIFLHGEDEFRSNQKIAEIKSKFLEKNKEGAPLSVFDFSEKDFDADEMIANMSSEGLFSRKKLIIVKNLLSGQKDIADEKFEKFLKSESKKVKSDLILVFWESGKTDKRKTLFKLFQKTAKCQEFEKLLGEKLKNWIKEKVSISPAAIEKLIVFLGNDLNLLSREIEKLSAFKGKGEISEADVDLLVKSKINTDIFRTVDALAQGDKKTALSLLHNHLEAGEDPFYLLSMYFYQFRNLLKVKPMAEKNIPEREIASRLGMHPFVARKSVEQGRNFSLTRLKNLYEKLCEIDFQSKTGKVDIGLALDKFVAVV